jgi:hypothetical protein
VLIFGFITTVTQCYIFSLPYNRSEFKNISKVDLLLCSIEKFQLFNARYTNHCFPKLEIMTFRDMPFL